MKQQIKRLIVPEGRKMRRLRGGLAKGMLMELELQSQSQRYWGMDEREVIAPLRFLTKGCRSLVDVGANDGYYTIAFLRLPAERVVACEPGDVSSRMLRNAAANGYELNKRFSLVCKPVGIGNDHTAMSDILEELPRPILVKVDIEGGEFDLLKSAENYNYLSDMRWLIETHSLDLENKCKDWFESRGFDTKILYNARWRSIIPELRPLNHNRWLMALCGE